MEEDRLMDSAGRSPSSAAVCARMHGGATGRVRVAAAQRQRTWADRARPRSMPSSGRRVAA